ncbi:MAG: glycosyltransferase family 2 protein [Lachnospiraceae bacterium]|nr:glycosyltransferase family 2 protein [Lachnospiraceae bacterium]
MRDNVHVTILTKVYNGENTIRDTIESVLGQTDPNWTYVIRNNGSTDRTAEICDEYAKKDARIKILSNRVNNVLDIESDNCDMDKQRSAQVLYGDVEGEYITFLDADDLLDEKFVEVTYKEAKMDDVDFLLAGFQTVSIKSKETMNTYSYERFFSENDVVCMEEFYQIYLNCLGVVWAKLYKTDLYYGLDLGEITDNKVIRRIGDTLLTMWYWGKCRRVKIIPEVLFSYMQREGSLSRKLPKKEEIEELELFFNLLIKHMKAMRLEPLAEKLLAEIIVTRTMERYIKDIAETGTQEKKARFFVHILKQPIFTEVCALVDPVLYDIIMKYIYINCVIKKRCKIKEDYIVELAICHCEPVDVYRMLNVVYHKDNITNCGYQELAEVCDALKPGVIKREDKYLDLMHNREKTEEELRKCGML